MRCKLEDLKRIYEQERRKMLLPSGKLIDHMINRGIKFEKMSEADALKFLIDNNNYFKLTSYRKNYLKFNEGPNRGKYIDLDFAYLVDLSIIDMHLRNILLKMCLDIEHYIKVKLLAEMEKNEQENGYDIVDKYICSKYVGSKDGKRYNKVIDDICKNSGSPYCGELLSKHGINGEEEKIENFPVWAFIEVISFGTLRDFYRFYYEYYSEKDEHNVGYLLWTVNQLRNALAHNNCIINNLYPIHPESVKKINTDNRVSNFLTVCGVGKTMKEKRMRNPRVNQISTTIYVFENIVTSYSIKKHRYIELHELVNGRMRKNCSYYSNNETIKSAYEFINKIVTHLYKKTEMIKLDAQS